MSDHPRYREYLAALNRAAKVPSHRTTVLEHGSFLDWLMCTEIDEFRNPHGRPAAKKTKSKK